MVRGMTPDPKPQTVRLKGKAYTAFRKSVHEKYSGRCVECGRYAPLLDADGVFDVFGCGHVAHLKSVGSGGHDILSNVVWKCPDCHLGKEHGPKWTKTNFNNHLDEGE